MLSVDRVFALSRQRLALKAEADERRLKACLEADAKAREQRANAIAATVTLRALSSACAHGVEARRPHDDKAALRPHPNNAAARPITNDVYEGYAYTAWKRGVRHDFPDRHCKRWSRA